MKKHILGAYRILSGIYSDGTYSNMAVHNADVSDMSVRLVYGTLENDVRSEYILPALADKKPQKAVAILLKIGIYALENLSDVPTFAIVSECVESAKAIGKGGASGFINAVLKKVASGDYKLPNENDKSYLSVKYSKPEWFVEKLIAQYGKETAISVLSAKSDHKEHIRVNSRKTDLKEVKSRLNLAKAKYEESDVGGLSVRFDAEIKKLFDEGKITFQSPSSMLAVQSLAPRDGSAILDVCSAPGGKAVYMSELCPKSTVFAGELHPHRIELIKRYAKRMGATNVKPVQADATKLREDWIGKFDYVLVDAPCSCFGTFLKHPDVFLSRGEEEILSLQATQKRIIKNAASYLAKGGTMVYSTCTLFDEENGEVVKSLLDDGRYGLEHIAAIDKIGGGCYVGNDGSARLLPHGEYDGFYIARINRI